MYCFVPLENWCNFCSFWGVGSPLSRWTGGEPGFDRPSMFEPPPAQQSPLPRQSRRNCRHESTRNPRETTPSQEVRLEQRLIKKILASNIWPLTDLTLLTIFGHLRINVAKHVKNEDLRRQKEAWFRVNIRTSWAREMAAEWDFIGERDSRRPTVVLRWPLSCEIKSSVQIRLV